jgi:hypothetical protein
MLLLSFKLAAFRATFCIQTVSLSFLIWHMPYLYNVFTYHQVINQTTSDRHPICTELPSLMYGWSALDHFCVTQTRSLMNIEWTAPHEILHILFSIGYVQCVTVSRARRSVGGTSSLLICAKWNYVTLWFLWKYLSVIISFGTTWISMNTEQSKMKWSCYLWSPRSSWLYTVIWL